MKFRQRNVNGDRRKSVWYTSKHFSLFKREDFYRANNFPILQPPIDNENGWIKFCSARCEEETKILPTLNTMFCLNQPIVEQVLEYLVEHIETQEKIDYELGQWIYALLVVLEMPLTPDTCSCLRTLARTCSIIRANSVMLNTKLPVSHICVGRSVER